MRISPTRKSAYFCVSPVGSSFPPLISHPVGLVFLLRRLCRPSLVQLPRYTLFTSLFFFGVANTCVAVIADVRYNLFLPVGASPYLLQSKFISSYQEMHLRTYISGEYVFVQKKRRGPDSNSDRRFREARFRAETRKNAIFLESIFGEVRIFATRKSAYFRISSVCSSIPPLISHPVGLSPLLRRWCRSLHFLPPCSFLLLRTHISFLLLRTHIFARRAPGPLFCIISDCCLPISFPHKRKCA